MTRVTLKPSPQETVGFARHASQLAVSMQIFSKKNRPRVVAVMILGVVALAWALRGGTGDASVGTTADVDEAANEEAFAEAPPASTPPAPATVANVPAPADEEPHGAVKHFKALTRYPASTRRLDEDSHDLLNPNSRHEKRGRLPGGKDDDLGWEVLYTADRYFLRGGESALISLQLWHDDKPVQPRNVTMVAEATDEDGQTATLPLSVQTNTDGSASLFIPNDEWPELVGRIKVTTTFSAEDLDQQVGYLDLYFTAASRIPAEFDGRFGDSVSGGDLVIDVGVDVRTAGRYFIEGNLYDKNSRPFGWARFDGQLGTGSQSAPLRFFGLVFHDTEAEPPYSLGELHGRRVRVADMPDREDMPDFAGRYTTTGSYDLSSFEAAEHDNPRRQRMLELYQDAIDRGVLLTDPEYVNAGTTK